MDNLNLNFLKIFYEVANCNSFLKAANKLYITQPAISRSIAKLEEELGVVLFNRANNGVSLTPYGQVLYKYIKESSDLLAACQRMLKSMSNVEDTNIVIGAQSHIVMNYLMKKIINFRQQHPNVKMKFVDMPTRDLIEELVKGNLDFVIDTSPIENIYNNIEITPIVNLDTCFIKSTKNKERFCSLEDLKNQFLILPSARSSLRKNLDTCFIEHNLEFEPMIEFTTEELIINAIKNNAGIGYVVKTNLSLSDEDNIQIIEMAEKLPKIEINLICRRKYMTSIAKKFIENELLNNEKDGGK